MHDTLQPTSTKLTWLTFGAALTAIWLSAAAAWSADKHDAPPPPSPAVALQRLKEGNERFAARREAHPHSDAARRRDMAEHGQHPFAAIIGCSDSRVPPEMVFDQGLGDLFVIRVAGNVCAADEAGSVEYAVQHLRIPLLVVLGHEQCGAVSAVVQGEAVHGSVPALVGHIQPTVEHVRERMPHLTGAALVSAAVEANVWHTVAEVLHDSDDMRHAIRDGGLVIVGAVYDLKTSRIRWLGRHPEEETLMRAAESSLIPGGHDCPPASQPASPESVGAPRR